MDQKTILRIAALISGVSGIIILIGVIYPIVSYNSIYGKNFSELVSPISENQIAQPNVAGVATTDSAVNDFTRASNWFVGGASSSDFSASKVKYFTVSIPKLKIQGASVAIGGEDLNKSLIQYPGTALPGRPGNTVIFGHSILPIFYNPKNYISMFSLLPTLTNGDEIDIDYDGVSYVYKVETMFEVHPTDIQVLDQDSSDSFVTLVTCTPPGDPSNPKRLIVRARVVPPTN
ncbi:MAG TPA: sortase [Patescibacteria group bacterium]|nr:sortase [Patescibacteria group bacterium]